MRATPLLIGGREYITCREAAQVYGCTMGYIRQQARAGRIHAMQIGRTWVVDAAQVRAIRKTGAGQMAKGFAPG